MAASDRDGVDDERADLGRELVALAKRERLQIGRRRDAVEDSASAIRRRG
jgi:hypothetical protein